MMACLTWQVRQPILVFQSLIDKPVAARSVPDAEARGRSHELAKTIQGRLNAEGLRVAVVASRWNDFIVSRLISGAIDALERLGASADHVTVIRVPGSFELPMAASRAARSGSYDALVCLGAIIRGETSHNEFIASEVFKGIAQISLETDLPIALGVVTADNLEQAIDRAGAKSGNKGFEAAMTAVELANLYREFR
jgi:6,7-dimethyl-8-ribityllumazine synthase